MANDMDTVWKVSEATATTKTLLKQLIQDADVDNVQEICTIMGYRKLRNALTGECSVFSVYMLLLL